MRILYSAIDQTVPGTTGGSVHVTAVAEGLAALGHEVHVLVTPGDGPFPSAPSSNPVRWMPMAPPFGAKQLRWMRTGAVAAARGDAAAGSRDGALLQLRRRRHDGGVRGQRQNGARGQRAGHRSCGFGQGPPRPRPHRRADAPVARAHLRPRRPHRHAERGHPAAGTRRRERSCASSGARIRIDSARTHRAHHRSSARRRPWRSLPARSGAGTAPSTSCARSARLQARGRSDIGAVLIGDGPELPAVQNEAAGLANVVFTGAVPHADMPACLAAADIGVAPFEIGAHRPLSLGFYWSPLKIFEYMAAGLPVVAPAVDRIPSLVADGREGHALRPDATRRPGARARDAGRPGRPPPARPRRPRARRPRVQLEGPLPGARQRDRKLRPAF